jgi:putative peptidoglycan lipid II flippase
VTAAATDRGTAEQRRRRPRGIGRPALLIGVITAVANVVGFGRQLVFAHTVGANTLGTAYATANQVPNIIYAIVLGGALTGMVVPVLAGPALAGPALADTERAKAKAQIRQTSSALLTWTLLLLVPVSLVVSLLIGHPHEPGATDAAMRTVGTQMLVVFAPQIALYGLAVVGYGILQAHRRFAAPALAPVLSSVVVAAAYFAFVPLAHGHQVLGLPRPAELMLAAGTTAGVAALAVTALAPVRRLRLRLRPTLRFPPGVAARVRALAIAGIAAVVAQNISTAVVIVLANAHGADGALVLYNYGWQVFFVPYAVLAVPIATSAFPVLSASAAEEAATGQETAPAPAKEVTQDSAGASSAGASAASASPAGAGIASASFDGAVASSTRGVMLASWLGVALLIGACLPTARVFISHNTTFDRGQPSQLAWALAAFAPGVAGFGLAANLSRVLFACRRTKIAAIVVSGGWLLVIVADLVIVPLVSSSWVVPALGLGNTIGLTVAGVALFGAVRRARGRAALRGVARAGLAGLVAAAAGAAAGAGVSVVLRVDGFGPNVGVVLLACAATILAFGLVVLALDRGEVRALAALATAKLTRKKVPA